MIVAIGLVVVAVGTVVFHFMSPWWWTPIASNWGYIDDTIILTFWITGVVFVAVILFTAYCVIKFKYRPEARAQYKPEDHKLEWWLTILTSVGVAAMLIPGLFVWNQYVTVPDNATEVEVMAKQWSWHYRLPGKDGKLGKSNVRHVNDENPYGIDPKDPNGMDDVLIDGDNLHLPLNKPVKMLLRSIDVLHDFYVPEFRAKMDMVPGAISYFWVEPIRVGTFDVLCFELCGVGHHAMRSQVVVDKQGGYDTWLTAQMTFTKSLAEAGTSAEALVRLAVEKAKAARAALPKAKHMPKGKH
ncbi:MAG: cytochrome c oxidase subunit II [Rhodospirillaceae bacterium]|jgi:cytochrome c oxidase subunit II|nr:cytochrome c oxidase subunit II [Rhodospirillaceae bacterium]